MCGLVGMAGDLTFKHRDVMKTLLFFNTLRGKDSTGVSAYNMRQSKMETRKITAPGYDFINMPWIDSLLSSVEGCWIGHGRHKTVGEVSRLNAHPFEVRTKDDKICMVGAHNGTLTNKYELQRILDEEFGTDSEALINLINKVGVKDAIKEASGAWALTFWDATDDSINLLRNDARPLYYTYTRDRKVLMWASEAWMLRIACARHDMALAQNPAGTNDAIWELTPNTLLKWVLPDFSTRAKPEDRVFGDPEREGGILGKPEKPFRTYAGNYGVLGYDPDDTSSHWWTGDRKASPPSKSQSSSSSAKEGEARSEKVGPGKVVGFEGEVVDKTYVAELLKQGCDWCGDSMKPDANYAWLDEMSICCMKCLRGEHFHVNVSEGTIVDKLLSIVKGGQDK